MRLECGDMGRKTGKAFARFRRWMNLALPEFFSFLLMAGVAKLLVHRLLEIFVVRSVWVMTPGTFPLLHSGMNVQSLAELLLLFSMAGVA